MGTTKANKSQRGGKVREVPVGMKTRSLMKKPRPPVPIRIMPDMVDRIDAVRDPLIPREPYVRWLVELGLEQVEAEG